MRLRNIPGSRERIAGSSFCVQEPEKWKGHWKELFGSENPVQIEVGMGKGRFLMDMAAAHPDINYVGIEMYSSVLVKAIDKAEQRAAEGKDTGNFRFIRLDARFLTDIFERDEVEAVWLNFSDPWPKSRHGGKRLTSSHFLHKYEQILIPGGCLAFKTDNEMLFDFSLREIEACGWTLTGVTRDLHNDPVMSEGNILTEYEEKFSAMGHPIFRLTALRRPDPGPVPEAGTQTASELSAEVPEFTDGEKCGKML